MFEPIVLFFQNPIFDGVYFFLSLREWVHLLAVIFLGFLASNVVAYLLISLLHRSLTTKKLSPYFESYDVKGMLQRPVTMMVMGWVWLLGFYSFQGAFHYLNAFISVAEILTYFGFVWLAWRFVDLLHGFLTQRSLLTETKFDDLMAPLITRTLRVAVLIIGFISIAEILKLPLSSLLAGFGLGGLAIAMAAKDTISNVFGSLTILVDRPFNIGDWVKIGDVEGSVEDLGFRSTRVRTFYNSLVTVPNSTLLTATVDNMGARAYRRIKMTLGVTYQTSPSQIDQFCEGVRHLILNHPHTRKDYFHVYFSGFGDSGLEILVYCFLETPDWGKELQERHRLFMDIFKLADSLGVSFAYPTRTLFLNNE